MRNFIEFNGNFIRKKDIVAIKVQDKIIYFNIGICTNPISFNQSFDNKFDFNVELDRLKREMI
jgi:hypothetical protein